MTMKQIRSLSILLAATLVLGISCGGGDEATPSHQAPEVTPQPSTPTVQVPTIDEASIRCDVVSNTIYFHATRPAGTKMQVLLCQQTNGTGEQLLEVSYSTAGKFFYVTLVDLVPGATYTYSIIGYNSKGTEAFRSAEQTFTMPKAAAPLPPSTANIQAYAPSTLHGTDGYLEGEVLTMEIEYSTDGGETWTAVTEDGVIRNLPPGKVLIRLAESPTTEAGMSAEVTVPEYHSNTDPDGDGGTSDGMRVKGERLIR